MLAKENKCPRPHTSEPHHIPDFMRKKTVLIIRQNLRGQEIGLDQLISQDLEIEGRMDKQI